DCPCTVEFLSGPLMVGSERISTYDTLTNEGLKLHILTPTDCIRDRLAWHVAYGDMSAVEQAARVAVALAKRVNFEEVKAWCQREDSELTYRLLEAQMRRFR
ncbi:MAG: hypothetical protein ACOCX1_02565, partial [Fimbriimonadaceae bacterium]